MMKKKNKFNSAISKTKEGFWGKINRFFTAKNKIDISTIEELEELLISSDIGVSTTIKIIDSVEAYVEKNTYLNNNELRNILKNEIINIISVDSNDNQFLNKNQNTPYVIMFVGVNGVGKTTTIGKLANILSKEGKKLLLELQTHLEPQLLSNFQNGQIE